MLQLWREAVDFSEVDSTRPPRRAPGLGLAERDGADRRGFSLRDQLKSAAPLATLWILGAIVLLVARFQTATSLRSLVLDPGFAVGAPWYTGAISNLGIMTWSLGVAFACAGAWVAHRIGRKSAARFLAAGAFATMILLFDDVFRLHSGPVRWLVGSKAIAQAAVVFPVVVWIVVFRDDIRRTRSILLLAALGSLAASVFIDVVFNPTGDTALLLEDGLKFLGILAWAQYFAITSRDIAASVITSGIDAAKAEPPPGDQGADADAAASPPHLSNVA